jgi:predicted peptidase
LSRGGHGTWGIGQILNKRIAAIVPICGQIHGITDFSWFKNMSVWISHCRDDSIVSYEETLYAVNKIEMITGEKFLRLNTAAPENENYLKSKYIITTFEKGGHDAWSETYDKVEIYKWLLKQKR